MNRIEMRMLVAFLIVAGLLIGCGLLAQTPIAPVLVGGYPAAVTTVAPTLGGVSASIGGGALTLGQCATDTVSITGASAAVTSGATITVTPNTFPGTGIEWNRAYISAADTVTVQVCATTAGTPIASTYNVKLIN